MKTIRFLFAVIASGILTLGVGLAADPARQPSERVPRENHPTSLRPAGPEHGNREQMEHNSAKSSQPGPLHIQSKRPPVNEPHQPGLQKSAAAANHGFWMNKPRNQHVQLAKLPSLGGAAAPEPGLHRSRSASPVALGGLSTASAKTSMASLDGAAFKRKP